MFPSILTYGTALACVVAASPLRAGSAAIVTGAIDFPKNRTSATSAIEGTCAGYRQAIAPANAGTEAAQQQAKIAAIRAALAAALINARW